MEATGNKIKAFEYVVKCLLDWHNNNNVDENIKSYKAFNKLKIFKLHFFVSAINADKNNDGLLDIFNNFYALPFGHVESDIYDNLNNLEMFSINASSLDVNEDISNYFDDISPITRNKIDKAVQNLKSENPEIINYSAFELVELSHQWNSWKIIFNLARNQGKYSLKIPIELIKSEPKFFFINQ